jgi:hypothetical protein
MATGQLGVAAVSSERFKTVIALMGANTAKLQKATEIRNLKQREIVESELQKQLTQVHALLVNLQSKR